MLEISNKFDILGFNIFGIDGLSIVNNEWNKIANIYVRGIPMTYLLAFTATNWPIKCNVYFSNPSDFSKTLE